MKWLLILLYLPLPVPTPLVITCSILEFIHINLVSSIIKAPIIQEMEPHTYISICHEGVIEDKDIKLSPEE